MAEPAEVLDEVDEWWSRALGKGERLGPARTRRAGWQLAAAEAVDELGTVGRAAVVSGFVLTPAQLRACGVDEVRLRRRVRNGEYRTVRRGQICVLPQRADGRPAAGSDEIEVAADARTRRGVVASHQSAACLHGLPVLGRSRGRTRLTVASVSHAGGFAATAVHAAGLPPIEIDTWFGVPVTSVARTVVDIARRSGVAAGLVTADAALREELVTEGALALSLARAHHRPGVVAAKRAVELARPGGESPLESLVRLCLIDRALPYRFELQAPIDTDRGTFRVDLYIREHDVVIEADGQLKYTRPRALWREKQRQDALERAGCRIVRVTWEEVTTHPDEVVTRVLSACRAPALVF